MLTCASVRVASAVFPSARDCFSRRFGLARVKSTKVFNPKSFRRFGFARESTKEGEREGGNEESRVETCIGVRQWRKRERAREREKVKGKGNEGGIEHAWVCSLSKRFKPASRTSLAPLGLPVLLWADSAPAAAALLIVAAVVVVGGEDKTAGGSHCVAPVEGL